MSIEQLYIMKKALLIVDFVAGHAMVAVAFVPLSLESRYIAPACHTHGQMAMLSIRQTLDELAVFWRAVSHPDSLLSLPHCDVFDGWPNL